MADACALPGKQTFVLDISKPAAVNKLKEKYFQQLTTIDILVNAAAIGSIKIIDTLKENDFYVR